MKRSTNFNGYQPRHRRIAPADMIAALRALGFTDSQIKASLQQLQQAGRVDAEQAASTPSEEAGTDAQ